MAGYAWIIGEINAALDFNFLPAQFGLRAGYYFPSMIDEPHKYLLPVSDAVKQWLASLRDNGPRTVV